MARQGKSFYDHFAENMEALGLKAPHSLFDGVSRATVTMGAIAGAIKTYGPKVTLKEILLTIPAVASAGAATELAMLGGAILASAYLGACIGSFAVAIGKTWALKDRVEVATSLHISGPWVMPMLAHQPPARRSHVA